MTQSADDTTASDPLGAPTPTLVHPVVGRETPRNRALIAWLIAGLTAVGVGVFITPFVFPIRPPIIKGIRSTTLFSPNGDRQQDQGKVSFRMNEAGSVTVVVNDPPDRGGKPRRVLHQGATPAGRLTLTWDGKDEAGKVVADGRYVISIRGRAEKRTWNSSRAISVDATAPRLRRIEVQSALSYGATGACRVTVAAEEPASLTMDVAPAPATGAAVALRGTTRIREDRTVTWNWDGTGASGKPVKPGLYGVRTMLTDRARNTGRTVTGCWVGHGGGKVLPAQPKAGAVVRVRLTNAAGEPLPMSTPVRLSLARRLGTPGTQSLSVVGRAVGGSARGPLGRVKLTIPKRIPPRELWLVATTANQRILIALRP